MSEAQHFERAAHHPGESVRAIRNLFAVSMVMAALVLVPATAASAHDALVDSSPAADATVTTELTEVTLTFSDVPLPGAPAVIQVTDAAGDSITTGDVTATDRSLSVPIEPTAVGDVSVVYQVVSSDAHTISSDFTFTYSGPIAAPSPSPSASEAEASASASPEPTPSASISPSDAVATEPASGTSASAGAFLPLIIAVLVAVIIAVVASIYRSNAARRKTLGRGDGDGPQN